MLRRVRETERTRGSQRLGCVLERGVLSGPALTRALARQHGVELEEEAGFGSGLRAEIERRHEMRRRAGLAPRKAVGRPASVATLRAALDRES